MIRSPSRLRSLVLAGLLTLPWAASRTFGAGAPASGPTWLKPQIRVYQPPAVEVSTSPLFRSVDPQIIQKLIDLLDERNLGEELKNGPDNLYPSLGDINTLITPEGLALKNRYTRVGVALSESLGWEPIKHVRVISEQNLKQRLTTVARWESAPNVRTIALIALAQLRDKNDLVYFQEALWSRNIGIRYAVVEALLKWGQPEAIPMLQQLVDRDDSSLIRVVAASALARLGQASGPEALRKDCDDKDWFVRALAAKALGEVGTADDYDFLLTQIDQEQINNANSNDFTLAEMAVASIRLFPQALDRERQQEEARKRKKNPSLPPPTPVKPPQPRKDVLFELEPLVVKVPRLAIPQNEPVDPRINYQLLKMLQDKIDEGITQQMIDQSQAYKDLNQLVTPNGISLKARYTYLGILLTEGLAGTKDFQIIDLVTRIARGDIPVKEPRVRYFALITLAYNHDRTDLNLFQQTLQSSAFDDRFAALEALGIWGLDDAKSILVSQTKLERAPVLRVYAAEQALKLGDLSGKDYLVGALNDLDPTARAMAMRYLGEMGGAEDYNRVLAFLGSQQPPIVEAEMCSSLLRLYAKKFEQEQKEGGR